MSNDKSRQREINNEIILLRQFVRQARICVISRLVREAKKLRSYRGNEKQVEKNKNKADKLLREVSSLKDIKDDEISKFGIINFDNLQDMLKNPGTDDGTKAMIKIARYKHLNEKILKLKEKFPDYREFVYQRKNIDSTKRKGTSISVGDTSEANRTRNRLRNHTSTTVEVGAHKEKRRKKDTRTITDTNHAERAVLRQNNEDKGELSNESSTLKNKLKGKESKLPVKVISKEAAVKRFVEVLEETDTKEESSEREENNRRDRRSSNDAVKRRKRIDEFFLSFDEEADSSDAVSFVEGNDNRGVSELDDRAFKAVRVKSNEEKFYKDKRERRENGRKERMHGKDISNGPSNRRKMSVTRSENIENAIEAKDENLHPSWAARRKQQESMKQGFQGKKIKFDEC